MDNDGSNGCKRCLATAPAVPHCVRRARTGQKQSLKQWLQKSRIMKVFRTLNLVLQALPIVDLVWKLVEPRIRDQSLLRAFKLAKPEGLGDEPRYKGMPASWLYGEGYKISLEGKLLEIAKADWRIPPKRF